MKNLKLWKTYNGLTGTLFVLANDIESALSKAKAQMVKEADGNKQIVKDYPIERVERLADPDRIIS